MKKLLLTTLIMALPARAELPLSLEGLNPEQNKFKLSVGLSYYNQNRDSYSQGRSQYLLTPQNQSIEIPGRLQNGRNNSDIFSTNVGLNYGLNDDTEFTVPSAATGAATAIPWTASVPAPARANFPTSAWA